MATPSPSFQRLQIKLKFEYLLARIEERKETLYQMWRANAWARDNMGYDDVVIGDTPLNNMYYELDRCARKWKLLVFNKDW